MARRSVRFVTEQQETVILSSDIEVVNHITGEIVPASDAPHDEAVMLRNFNYRLAFRDDFRSGRST